VNASSPPADAPIPTVGTPFNGFLDDRSLTVLLEFISTRKLCSDRPNSRSKEPHTIAAVYAGLRVLELLVTSV
jgi:hypothetical protein